MKRLLLFAALIAWSGIASAVVYKWVDAQGKLQYGDLPPDGVHAEVVELLGTHASAGAHTASPASAPSAAAPSAAAPAARTTTANLSPKELEEKRAVDQDVAEVKDKQCAEAQDRYKKLIEGRRIYKAGPDGERQYMTSDEIDTERLNAKRDVDTICNSAT